MGTDSNTSFKTTFEMNYAYHIDIRHDVIVMVYSRNHKYLGNAVFSLERILHTANLYESLPVEAAGGNVIIHAKSLDKHLVR